VTDVKKKSDRPVVSVVVAVKNGATTLQRCIDSFTRQTFPAKELIIMDGGSADGTVDIIHANAKTIAYWESRADSGIAQAWNRALPHTRGEWVIFLGADDYFYDDKVFADFSQRRTAVLDKQRIVYGQINLISANLDIISTSGQEWRAIQAVFFSEKMMIPHQACFHHHTVFNDYGAFDENLTIVADYDFLLRVLKIERPLFLPEFIVSNMFFGGISSQVTTLLKMQSECDKALRKNGFKPRGYKRFGNILVYKFLGLVVKSAGEKTAALILDKIRVLLGRRPIWTLK
jgi:glycosyltransferase involved in cell wall biosynthesis